MYVLILYFLCCYILAEGNNWQYEVIIDCGSSGSRVYVYQWQIINNQDIIIKEAPNKELNVPLIYKIEPGLSSYEPNHAYDAIKPLIEYLDLYLDEMIPKQKIPIYICYCWIKIFK